VWDWDTISGNFITQIIWHGYINTPFTYEFAEELLWKAGFADVRRVGYLHTVSSYPEIVELDSREGEVSMSKPLNETNSQSKGRIMAVVTPPALVS
jgi:hypothetical protein